MPTFLALLEDLSRQVLSKLMKQKGWQEVPLNKTISPAGPDLVIVDGKFNWDRRLYTLPCRMKGLLNAKIITNKGRLHALLMKHAPHLIAETRIITPKDVITWPAENQPWILRPVSGWEGKGVEVATSALELKALQKTATWTQALLSKYIVDPMLINERKFHLRIYFIVVATPSGKRTGVYRRGKIIHAANTYRADDYTNKRIHDTHRRWSTPCFFPDDFPGDADSVFASIVSTLQTVSQLALPDIKWYNEASDGGFYIHGCDFMIDNSGKVFLIEINNKTGFKCPSDTKEQVDNLSEIIFQGLVEFVIDASLTSTLVVPLSQMPAKHE